jgi:hypothetical protein
MSNCCSWGKLLLFNYLINIYYTKKTDKIVDEILALPVVISVWENITDLDCDISNECKKLVLENFVKLFVRVRSFSYAKDIVNRYKLKEKTSKKALKTELKKKPSEMYSKIYNCIINCSY